MIGRGYGRSSRVTGGARGRLRGTVGLILALLVAGLVTGPAVAHAQAMDPALVSTFIVGENAHDVAGVTALFADNATVTLATGPLQGKEQIRAWQQELADGHFTIEVTSPVTVSGTKADYTVRIALDTFRQLGLATLDGTEEMVVENGKITNFVFAFTPESAARFQEALAGANPAPGMPRTGGGAAGIAWWAVLLGSLLIGAAGWALRRRAPALG